MPDLLEEDLLSSAAAARFLNDRMRDARFTPIGMWRWMTKGMLDTKGVRVRLEHAKLGRKLVTSRQALSRFAARLAQARAPGDEITLPEELPGRLNARADLTAMGFFD